MVLRRNRVPVERGWLDHSGNPVRRCWHAPLAGVAGGYAETVPASGRWPLDLSLTLARIGDESVLLDPVIVASRRHHHLVVATLALAFRARRSCSSPRHATPRPPIAAAASWASSQDPEAVILVLAADHVIRDVRRLSPTPIRTARPAAESGEIVVFGIKPAMPATGFGYIRRGRPLDGHRRRQQGRRLRREAGRGDRRTIHCRRLSLEQRQLHDAGRDRACRSRAKRAPGRRSRQGGGRRRRDGRQCRRTRRRPFARAQDLVRPRRDGEDESRRRRRRRLSTGPTSAPGPRSGKPRPRTMPATSRPATSSSSTRPATMSAPIGRSSE